MEHYVIAIFGEQT